MANWHAKYRAELAANPGDRRHGTETGYAYGCRCDECLEAGREAWRLRRRREAAARRAKAEREREEQREAAANAREKPRGAARGPKRQTKDVCTVPEYLKPLMGRPSLDRADGRCVWCGAPATDRHHIVKRSQGRWVRDGVEVRKPTVRLCGSGNASGCHGKAHAGLLHFRWKQAEYDKLRQLMETSPGLPGHWEGLETKEPCDTLTAWGKTRGWRKLG